MRLPFPATLSPLIKIRLSQDIVAIDDVGADARIISRVEASFTVELLKPVDFPLRKHAVFDDQRTGLPTTDQRQPPFRMIQR